MWDVGCGLWVVSCGCSCSCSCSCSQSTSLGEIDELDPGSTSQSGPKLHLSIEISHPFRPHTGQYSAQYVLSINCATARAPGIGMPRARQRLRGSQESLHPESHASSRLRSAPNGSSRPSRHGFRRIGRRQAAMPRRGQAGEGNMALDSAAGPVGHSRLGPGPWGKYWYEYWWHRHRHQHQPWLQTANGDHDLGRGAMLAQLRESGRRHGMPLNTMWGVGPRGGLEDLHVGKPGGGEMLPSPELQRLHTCYAHPHTPDWETCRLPGARYNSNIRITVSRMHLAVFTHLFGLHPLPWDLLVFARYEMSSFMARAGDQTDRQTDRQTDSGTSRPAAGRRGPISSRCSTP
jgi:hypothetical protein